MESKYASIQLELRRQVVSLNGLILRRQMNNTYFIFS